MSGSFKKSTFQYISRRLGGITVLYLAVMNIKLIDPCVLHTNTRSLPCGRRISASVSHLMRWRCFLCGFSPGATSIEQYCLRRDTWRQVATMSGRRLQFGVAVLAGRLYVVGGRDGLKTLNTVECYNPHSKAWSVMPPMSTHRHGLGEPPCLETGISHVTKRARLRQLGQLF